jgi:hypothetical protein
MDAADSEAAAEHNDECPACGGPAIHPGVCVDQDGYVLPAYAELAEMWQEQGRPVLTAEDLSDLEEMLNATDEDRRAT